jgi:hypothetical protein
MENHTIFVPIEITGGIAHPVFGFQETQGKRRAVVLSFI